MIEKARQVLDECDGQASMCWSQASIVKLGAGNIMNTENKTHTFTVIIKKLQSWRVAPLPESFVIEAIQTFGRTPVIATLNGKVGHLIMDREIG